ncbi:hypothetical protein ACFXPI_33215 [Streptomyces sp. NPDC059104]|uniref:hypothetical protein n=1 Tax=Streptomyces sp. NPDC059104 TaxID=3346729 RepID=UPI00367E1064
MLDTSPLTDAVERFADRLRAAPQSRLQRGAAAEALDLARELALRTQRLEDPSGRAPERVVPDAGIFVVGDQVSVTGLDLAEALGALRDGDDAKAPSELLDEAVALVERAEVRAMR